MILKFEMAEIETTCRLHIGLYIWTYILYKKFDVSSICCFPPHSPSQLALFTLSALRFLKARLFLGHLVSLFSWQTSGTINLPVNCFQIGIQVWFVSFQVPCERPSEERVRLKVRPYVMLQHRSVFQFELFLVSLMPTGVLGGKYL